MLTSSQHPLYPVESSDGAGIPYDVIRDEVAASDNMPAPLNAVPDTIDFRNHALDTLNFATSKFRSAMVHSASGGTASFRVYMWPVENIVSRNSQSGNEVKSQPEGFKIADMTITYAGGIVYGRCPFTGRVIDKDARPGFGQSYDNSSARFYKASSISFTSQYSTDVIGTLRSATDAAANEVQTLTFSGTTTGNFTLTATVNGVSETTADIAWSGTAATLASNIDSALEALAIIPASAISVTSNASPAVTFTGDLGGQEHPLLTIAPSATSGADGTLSVARTTAGNSPESEFRLDNLKNKKLWIEPYAMDGSRVVVAATPWQK